MSAKFLDLHACCEALGSSELVHDRIVEFAERHPGTWITAVGGFPLHRTESQILAHDWHWAGSRGSAVEVESAIRSMIRDALAQSAVLTYMNRSRLDTDRLADICLDRGHDWALRWIPVSLTFVAVPLAVELAFLRDARFLTSWPVTNNTSAPRLFTATASIKDWLKFVSHAEDKDFDRDTRAAMLQAKLCLDRIVPGSVPTPKPKPHLEQHFLKDFDAHRALLQGLRDQLENKSIFEIGAGHGELTKLILELPVCEVHAVEIDAALCECLATIRDERLFIIPKSYSVQDAQHFKEHVWICNPPYSLLETILEDTRHVAQAIILVNKTWLPRFEGAGFSVVTSLVGAAFDPPSKGEHHIVAKGFQR